MRKNSFDVCVWGGVPPYKVKNSNEKKVSIYVILLLLSVFIGVTIAFFANSEFATSLLGMSGKVKIEAVGKGNKSIEDNSTCNLEIQLDRDYGVLIPNMPITIYANCKVKRSTTKPLLRAKFQVTVFDKYGNPYVETGENLVSTDIYTMLCHNVLDDDSWYLHTDGYFYYIQILNEENKENSILQEVDATTEDTIVNFLNNSTIRIPSYIDDSYSGLNIKIKIVFQAIQNYIPDNNGNKLPNTITNSLKIFNEFKNTLYESSPLEWFNISTTADGKVSLSTNPEVEYPENLRLPDKTADGKVITTLSKNLFKGNGTVKNVYIPSSYTTIEEQAFAESGIISVDASESNIVEIGKWAFSKSNITSIKFPENLIKIDDYAFYSCRLLNDVVLTDKISYIGYGAFASCSMLTNMSEIPASVTNLKADVFSSCPLLRINVNKDNANYYDKDEKMLLSKNGELLKYASCNKSTELIIPDEVTTLCYMSLYGSDYLKTITLSKNLQNVGTSYVFPSSATNIEIGSNTYFSKLKDVYNNIYLVQNSTKNMIWGNFSDTATTMSIPDEVVVFGYVIGQSDNKCKKITKIEIGKNLQKIDLNGLYYFKNNIKFVVHSENKYFKTLTGKELISYDGTTFYEYAAGLDDDTYEVSNTITTISRWSFAFSKLKNVVLPETIVRIKYTSFSYMKYLENINIPEGVIMENNCFTEDSSLKNITLNATFSNDTLNRCSNLETVTFGIGVDKVSINLLNKCKSLKWIEFQRVTPPTFDSALILQNTNDKFVIYVPDGSVDAYKTANNFTSFASRIKAVSERI